MDENDNETSLRHRLERIENTLIDLTDVRGELKGADIEKALKDNGVIE